MESHEEFLTFQEEASADSRCSLVLGQVAAVEFGSVEEIMMSVGCLTERARWCEREWSFRRDSDCVGKCDRLTL